MSPVDALPKGISVGLITSKTNARGHVGLAAPVVQTRSNAHAQVSVGTNLLRTACE